MRALCLSVLLLAAAVVVPLSALELDISPNKDGSFDVFVGLDWRYGGRLYGGVSGSYRNVSSEAEEAASYVATFGKTLFVGIDLMGVDLFAGSFRGHVALNAQWDRMDLRELGYIDSSGTRYFVLNDRVLNLILPRLEGGLKLSAGPWTLSAGGEVAPWLWVSLDQQLTISPLLAETPYHSAQSALGAFSANAQARLSTRIISPVLFVEYDHLGIAYGV